MLTLLIALSLTAPADDKKAEPTKFEKAWGEAEEKFKKVAEDEPAATKKKTEKDLDATLALKLKNEELYLSYQALSKAGLTELITVKAGDAMKDKEFRKVMEKLHESPKPDDLMAFALRWQTATPVNRKFAAGVILNGDYPVSDEVKSLARRLK